MTFPLGIGLPTQLTILVVDSFCRFLFPRRRGLRNVYVTRSRSLPRRRIHFGASSGANVVVSRLDAAFFPLVACPAHMSVDFLSAAFGASWNHGFPFLQSAGSSVLNRQMNQYN